MILVRQLFLWPASYARIRGVEAIPLIEQCLGNMLPQADRPTSTYFKQDEKDPPERRVNRIFKLRA